MVWSTWNSAPSMSRANRFTRGRPTASRSEYRGRHCSWWVSVMVATRCSGTSPAIPFSTCRFSVNWAKWGVSLVARQVGAK